MNMHTPEIEAPPPIFEVHGQPFNWPFWMGKTISLDVESPASDLDLVVNIQCAQKELYKYFPFHVWIYFDGKPVHVAEFSKEYGNVTLEIPVPDAGHHTLRLDSELTGCPRDVGLSEDVRHLSIQLNRATWQTSDRTPRRPAPPVRHFDTRYEALSDHSTIHPIFVIGAYRSGTSISTWVLGQHPNIVPIEENTLLIMKYYSAIANHKINHRAKENFADIYDVSLEDYLLSEGEGFHNFAMRSSRQRTFSTFLESISLGESAYKPGFSMIRSAYNPKTRWVNGTPENSTIASGLKDMFPNAKMIFMLRRPRDVISSLMRFDALGERARTFDEAAFQWERLTYRAYEAYQRLGPDTVFLADYERLKTEPAALIREWWEFLDEPYFDKAVETTRHTINSSGENREGVEIDESAMGRLNMLCHGMLSEAPLESLPWREDMSKFDSVRNNLVNKFVDVIS